MTDLPVEVPAHVRYQTTVHNHVQVKGGSNWDLSRGAVETPIGPYVEPTIAPADEKAVSASVEVPTASATYGAGKAAAGNVVHSVVFDKHSAQLSSRAKGLLSVASLPAKDTAVVVTGHAASDEMLAEKLAHKRAASVAAELKRLGHKKVEVTKAPAKDDAATPRVDILAR